uniref:FAD-binding domain-containing protein n=1 Tax=Rhodosorus marinus TaxID=101924 RepID=A0A7S0BID9_9RHOD|mmetsp:Transcript_17848/g.25772  ORF Transcript_17848/g.25772 Transcript_17848/m.25772 type:complete len:487 (+) Transcript_17848:139-1599(+)
MGFAVVNGGVCKRPRGRSLCRLDGEKGTSNGTAVVVGGGPTGLGCAMVLAKQGWDDVIVAERLPGCGPQSSSREYTYALKKRTMRFAEVMGFDDQLRHEGVAIDRLLLEVIDKSPERKRVEINAYDKDGVLYMRRKKLLKVLTDQIKDHYYSSVSIMFETQCVVKKDESDKLVVELRNLEGDLVKTVLPKLILACDGVHSKVRTTFETTYPQSFGRKIRSSPSAGLLYKALRIKGEALNTSMHTSVILRGGSKPRERYLQVGLFPSHEEDTRRIGSIVLPEDNDLWKIDNCDECYEYFQEHFPRISVRDIIDLDDMKLFLSSTPGRFPHIQWSTGFHSVSENAAYVILGDAAHSTPPDIGEGVNCCMEDLHVLHDSLQRHRNDLAAALEDFEDARRSDVEALMRITGYAHPYLYNQNSLMKKLWTAELALRVVLNKILPIAFDQHIIFLINEYSYSEALRRDLRTKTRIYFLTVASLSGLLYYLNI